MDQNEQQDTEAEVNRTLYVSGLSPETTDGILRELFIQVSISNPVLVSHFLTLLADGVGTFFRLDL